MATVPPKHHQPLHNFSLPFLKWGQRVHHCRRRHHRNPNSSPTDSSDSDPDLNTRHTTKPKIQNQNHTNDTVLPDKGTKVVDVDVVTADDGDVKPWNLRPRRLVIDGVDGNGGVKLGRVVRCGGEEENQKEQVKKQRRLWISLSKDEIEEDVYAFTGSRPVRRPKKRNKTAQKHVDNVFPGLYLVGVSADSYRV